MIRVYYNDFVGWLLYWLVNKICIVSEWDCKVENVM